MSQFGKNGSYETRLEKACISLYISAAVNYHQMIWAIPKTNRQKNLSNSAAT